jgi:hypothetical protein
VLTDVIWWPWDRYFSLGPECLALKRKYSATAAAMNAPYGRANVMIVPPKYIAGPSAIGSADTVSDLQLSEHRTAARI